MERVVALVVQPGVEFGNAQVFRFDRMKAAALSDVVAKMPGVVFEAHSTDFQSEVALGELVASHFAILKVGPELTYAFREAIVAMTEIEDRLVAPSRSNVISVLEQVMDENDAHWRSYVAKSDNERIDRLFGLSDRVRYYWSHPLVAGALDVLAANIDGKSIHPGLISQFAGTLIPQSLGVPLSRRIISSKVDAVVAKYRRACNPSSIWSCARPDKGEIAPRPVSP
jgi:D-tagatose-1,6-bisphosphate aldolase subunit GatZ/KbaZ